MSKHWEGAELIPSTVAITHMNGEELKEPIILDGARTVNCKDGDEIEATVTLHIGKYANNKANKSC